MTNQQLDQQISAALAEHHAGHFRKAKELYESILGQYPGAAEVLHFMGILSAQMGDLNTAISWLKKALTVKPDEAHYHNSLANVLKRLDNYKEAIQEYEQALTLEPDSAETHNNLANLYYQKEDISSALQHYAAAVNLQPDYIDAHFNLGLLFIKQEKVEEAIKQFTNVLQLSPQHLQTQKNLADLYLQKNDLKHAVQYYQSVLTLEPSNLETLNNLGVVYLKLEKPEIAIDYFIRVVNLDETHIDARNNLAATYLQQDRYENASRNYKELLKLTPDDLDVHYNLGVAQMALGELQEAIEHFQIVLEKQPNRVDVLNNLGVIYLKIGDTAKALKAYQQAHNLEPDNALVNYMLNAITHKETPEKAPAQYVKNLFDNYAAYYDKHVSEVLHYQAPALLRQAVEKLKPKKDEKWSILDLGCGSGLSGELFRGKVDRLIGIDLSTKMIKLARAKNIYDALIVGDITQALAQGREQFDVIIAADVFVYIGDLIDVFNASHRLLKKEGLFAFTVEALAPDDKANYRLQQTARFAHSKNYIHHLAKKSCFQIEICDNIMPRYQENKPLSGYLFVLRRAAVTSIDNSKKNLNLLKKSLT